MKDAGTFFGIGVGPGERGLIPLIAWQALEKCHVIFTPRARGMDHSVARKCLPANAIPKERFREIEFSMDPERNRLAGRYAELAETIALELLAGRYVAYLTLGDPLTYSTYIYALAALKERLPDLRHRTFPGVTSYNAVAAATGFALGEGKQSVLILPCPDSEDELRSMISRHDVVVLLKIGHRLPAVLRLVREMEIAEHCVFGHHVGMADERLSMPVDGMEEEKANGYLSTMLIRKNAAARRHVTIERDRGT
jgi:precorrin-2/cobalt-factor-2 C20-methyltransferase